MNAPPKGLRPANAIWLWGQGRRPRLQNFEERFGVKGVMVSAVDLLKGIRPVVWDDGLQHPGCDRIYRYGL